MLKNPLQSQIQQATSSEKQEPFPDYEFQMSWRIRWFVVKLLGGAYATFAVSGIAVFLLTGNPSLLTISQTLLLLIISLVPLDEKRYLLKALKIQAKALSKREKTRK